MVNWHRFEPKHFEYDFETDKLKEHGVSFFEATECFFDDFTLRRNKKHKDRFQLVGRTMAGRRLKIIFQLKTGDIVRIITGWPL